MEAWRILATEAGGLRAPWRGYPGNLFDPFEARAAAQRKNSWTQCQGQIEEDEMEFRGKEEKMTRK